ncbi:TBC1 domain family member 22A-like isoform X1 [Mercenaria mercenaria]|uniref:TBC1 domain family member 22A-like isoform X1 n=1 Tax=Mercenaria mercenaria TaxID=6596 RepID=UPI00234F239A|nr:TBC1 domain family member 22A-like isoform X1 [Mercenaria mercenaria]
MSVGGNSVKDHSKSGFWKRSASGPGSGKPVYGAQHPPMQQPISNVTKKDEKSRVARTGDSFQDFENKTLDAWDDGDDDLMLDMANIKMSMKDIQSTAKAVLDHHRQTRNANLQYNGPNLGPGHHKAAPGMGIRINNSWQPPKPSPIRYTQETVVDKEVTKLEKIKTMLAGPNTNMVELQKLSWSGIPKAVRPTCWKILSGYLPTNVDRREQMLERKRQEYFSLIDQYYASRHDEMHQDTFRQILKDVPRMTSLAHLFQQKRIQEIFERILYIWAIRHPASGYVQGINDLVTPFFVVFLSEFIENDIEVENINLTELPEETLNIIEADTFWCTSKLLDGIQDNYTFAQPGIQTKVNALRELVKRIDAQLHAHLEEESVEYLQFAFRWMNNLLMREIPLRCSVRLWDTYLCEPNGFADFHLYVCAAFLTRFSKDLLREKDFQGILMFLQNLPTHHWHDDEISEMLAEAFKLKYMFADAPNHLSKKS